MPPTAPVSSTSARRGRDRVPVQDPGADRGGCGLFSKDRFVIDLATDGRDLPGGDQHPDPCGPRRRRRRHRLLRAGLRRVPAAGTVHHREGGRTISVGPHEQALADARARQIDPAWVADYRATRPKVERKLGHPCAAARWTTSPGPRHRPRRCRLPVPRRRGQPRTPGRARPARNRQRMGGGDLTRTREATRSQASPLGPRAAVNNLSGSAQPRPQPLIKELS